MKYADRRALESRFSVEEIQRLDDGSGERVSPALVDTEAEIDGALAEAYELPLPADATYPQLMSIACDLARDRLYDTSPPETVTSRARMARKHLRGIVAGDASLINGEGATVPRRTSDIGASAGPEPAMTDENLRGL